MTEGDDFNETGGGKLCILSMRKLPATYVWRNGCSCDDIDARRRWKSNHYMVDTNSDHSIPYSDAKLAALETQ